MTEFGFPPIRIAKPGDSVQDTEGTGGSAGKCCGNCRKSRPCCTTASRGRGQSLPGVLDTRANPSIPLNGASPPATDWSVTLPRPSRSSGRPLSFFPKGGGFDFGGMFEFLDERAIQVPHDDDSVLMTLSPQDQRLLLSALAPPIRRPFSLSSGGRPSFDGHWPLPAPDCSFASIVPKCRIANSCKGSRRTFLLQFHILSYYYYTLRPLKLLSYILAQNETWRNILWNWGDNTSPWAYMWNENPRSRFSSLAFWFGPFSSTNLVKIFATFGSLAAYFEKGFEVWGVRHTPRYWCNNDSGCSARHPFGHNIQICQPFWESAGNNDQERFHARWSIVFHESIHHINGVGQPRDLTQPQCMNLPPIKHGCYEGDISETFPWTAGENPPFVFGSPPSNPRRLVEANKIGGAHGALNNVDNYMGWALRSFYDVQAQFACGGPLPPGTIEPWYPSE